MKCFENLKKYFLPFFAILLILANLGESKIIVVNSQNWEDVYISLLYGQKLGYQTYFLNNPNPQALLRSLPSNQDVLLIESENYFYPGLDSLLSSKGFKVEKLIVKNPSLELLNFSVDNVYLIYKDFSYGAIIVTPLALSTNGWVFILDRDNYADILTKLEGKNVFAIGYFPRDIKDAIKKYVNKEIADSNKFRLSLKVADEVIKINKASQVTITDGRYIEKEFFLSKNPILLVGTNLLPDETLDWMIRNNIKSVVIIGSHLTYIGEQIRSKSNKSIGVFIKYGEAVPGSPVYALTMLPLPFGDIKLNVTSVIYDPNSKSLIISIRNTGNSGAFVFTTSKIMFENSEIASIADKEPVFLGANSIVNNRYSIEIPAEYLEKDIIAELYISYGDSSESLDSFLTEEGSFGPPLRMKINVMKVSDSSEIEIISASYYYGNKRLAIEINNTGNVDAYVIIKIPKLIVKGINKAFSSDIIKISPNEKRNVVFNVELDDFDLEDNKDLFVIANYGEREHLLVKSKEVKLQLNVIKGIDVVGMIVGGGSNPIVVGIILLGVIIIFYFRKLKNRKEQTSYIPEVTNP